MPGYPAPLARLIEELRKLPGIGNRSAQRLALYLVGRPPSQVTALTAALEGLTLLRACSVCRQFTEADPCPICSDPGRDRSVLCVVSSPSDALAVEATGEYRGLYHVLHGVLDPLAGVGPAQLGLELLERRLGSEGGVREVILAMDAGVEGEATAAFLARRLADASASGVRISRPAQGMPAGGEVEFTDRLTLARAFRGRRPLD
jgi:recombination protein RecR